eukprot:40133-Eustigmatos_ZCMA.PRE.1
MMLELIDMPPDEMRCPRIDSMRTRFSRSSPQTNHNTALHHPRLKNTVARSTIARASQDPPASSVYTK